MYRQIFKLESAFTELSKTKIGCNQIYVSLNLILYTIHMSVVDIKKKMASHPDDTFLITL